MVRVTVIEETTLGETPVAGNFDTVRFTSEGLSATPETTQSQQIRTDRLASGNIVTGLTVEGEIGFEVAKDPVLDLFISSAMLNSWDTKAIATIDMTIVASTKTITADAGNFTALDLKVGDFITLSDFLNSANNVRGQIVEIVSATEIVIATKNALVDETKVGSKIKRADRISIGTTPKSFSMEKAFLDVAGKANIYKGMLANTMNLSVAYGEILNGTFGFNGTQGFSVDTAPEFITNGRTINDPATTNSMNGSVDMPLLITSALGDLEVANFCIQSLEIALNNNYTPQTCIGKAAPVNYTPGTAEIEVNLSSYLSTTNWPILEKKLTQEPFAIGFLVENLDGFYGFFLPALQVSFPDPSSSGPNQEVSLEMSGQARVGLSGESSLTIYRG